MAKYIYNLKGRVSYPESNQNRGLTAVIRFPIIFEAGRQAGRQAGRRKNYAVIRYYINS